MKRIILSLTLVIALLAASSAEAAGARKILVSSGATGAEVEGLCLINGCGVVQHLPFIDGIVITLPAKASDKALAALLAHNKVILVEDDAVVSAVGKPEKPGKPPKDPEPEPEPEPGPPQEMPWGINRIDAEFAWATSTGAGVNVAVLDTGIDYNHPDLAANYKGGYNAIRPRKSPMDDNGHGTHCAGTIAALNNDFGVVGVAPDANLYAVKVLDRRGSGYLSDIIEGFEWSINNDIDVISMSLSTDSDIQSFHDAVDATSAAGIILVAAAGNDAGVVDYPAAYGTVVAVSATGDYENWMPSDALASFSNFGDEIDVAAPGVAINSTARGGDYVEYAGTSMACPHVVGVVALMLKAGTWSLENLKAAADDIGLLPVQQGAGLVDAEEAAAGTEAGDN